MALVHFQNKLQGKRISPFFSFFKFFFLLRFLSFFFFLQYCIGFAIHEHESATGVLSSLDKGQEDIYPLSLARQSGQWTSRVSGIHLGNLLEMQNLTPYPGSNEVYIPTNCFVILMHIKVWETPPSTFSSSFYYASWLTLPKQLHYLDIFPLDSQLNEWIITL